MIFKKLRAIFTEKPTLPEYTIVDDEDGLKKVLLLHGAW